MSSHPTRPVGRGEAGEGGRLHFGGGRSFRQTAALARRASERARPSFHLHAAAGEPAGEREWEGTIRIYYIHIRSVDSYSAAMLLLRDMAGSTAPPLAFLTSNDKRALAL